MAKGILDKVDLSQQAPQKGSNLTYQGVQSPVQPVRPPAGLLKKVLSQSKESEQFSPYKKKVAAPIKVQPQTPVPSPTPVQAKPILTEDVLEPIAPMEERVSKRPETVVVPKTPEKPFTSVMEPLEETRKMAVDFEGKVRKRVKDIADAIYSSPDAPDKAKDVWENEVNQGLKDGTIHAVVGEDGEVDIKRKAPGLFEAFWEGQKGMAEGLREGVKYELGSRESNINTLENNYINKISSLGSEETTATNIARTAGGLGGQILTQAAAVFFSPITGGGSYAANVAALASAQDLQSQQEAFDIAREKGLSAEDAYDIAQKGKYTYLGTGIAESVVSSFVAGRLLKAGVNASTAAKGFINASKQFMRTAASKSGEIGIDAAVAATASVIRDSRLEETTGGDVNIKERALDNALLEIAAGGALTGIGVIYGQGKQYLPKWMKSQSLNMASNLDKADVEAGLRELQSKGQIDEAGVKQALEDIDKWKETKANNPDIPEEKAPTLIGYFTQKQNLEESLKKADESSQPAILKKIEDINNKIAEARNNPEPLATEQDDIIQEPIVKEPVVIQNKLSQYNRKDIVNDDVINLKYDDNGKEVGGVTLGKFKNYLTLNHIYFSPEYRGTGLSKFAYKDALDMAKQQGYEGLMVGGQLTTEYKTKETYKNFKSQELDIKNEKGEPYILLTDWIGKEQAKPQENATTISQEQQQEGPTTSNISEYQGVEGQQEQASNEADNRNRPISGKTQQELEVEPIKEIPKIFNNEEGKTVFAKMNTAADNKLKRKPGNTRAASGEAVRMLKNSSWYKGLTDLQRDAAVRTAVKYFGEKVPSAPSVARLFGQVNKEITVQEKTALKRLMKFGEESATGAIEFSKSTREGINQGLKELGKRGVIKVNQFNSILNKYNNVNVENEKSIEKFVNYASNIIKDANYDSKLKEAENLRNNISKNAKVKGRQVNLSNAAKEFAQLNPADVENIDTYIGVAGNVFKGIRTSKATKNLSVDFSQPFSEKDVNTYTEAQKSYIEQTAKESKMADYQDLVEMGVISPDMSFDEMETIISSIEENPNTKPAKDKEINIRAYVNKRFNSLSAMAESMLDKNNDGFGVKLDDIDPKQKKIVKEVLSKGIEKMPIKDAYRIVESLSNFITNGKTSGLDAILARYDGNFESEKEYKAGTKSRPLKLLFRNDAARWWSATFDSVPIKLVRMFGSTKAPKIQRAMGLAELENNKAKAVRIAYDTDKRFINEFKNKKANGEDYNSLFNITEQGMLAFVRRNNGGSDQDIQNEFNRRKGLIEESIDVLKRTNNEQEVKKSELYQQVYDKILSDSQNAIDVDSKVDDVNRQVVNWWTNEWAKHYDNLRDVTLNVYNQDLGKDNNYNPDIFKKTVFAEEETNLFENSAYSYQYDYIPQKKSGTLIKAERPSTLPENRVIDLGFTKNNSKALKSALVDIYTAKDVRKVDAFLKAPSTAKMINEDDLRLLRSSISDYVKRSRGMEGVDLSEFNALQRSMSTAGKFVTSAALGGVVQPLKQTVPLIIKTMINTNGQFAVKESVSMALSSQSPVNKFLNDAGYGISIRGMESSTGITSIDNLIKDNSASGFNKFMDFLDKWNESVLKYTVSNPDKWVARAVWVTYYKKALQDSGIDTSNIDWDTHQVVPEAADYAQSMVDTQQNVSDRDLMGKFMGSKDASTAATRSLLMPFSGFIMNAKSKMQADVINSLASGSSAEEKAASRKSLAGTIGEMVTFNLITGFAGLGLLYSYNNLSGDIESEREEEKKWQQAAKGATTNFASDILSPFPQTNALVGMGINELLQIIDPDTPEELKFRLYGESEKPIYQDFGLMGIGAKKIVDFATTAKEYATSEFEQEAYGKKTIKKISEEDRDKLRAAAIMQSLYLLRIVPLAELANLSNKITRQVERRALTEKQDAIAQVVAEQKIEGATVKVNGEDISKAISKAVAFKDPEARANYLLKLADQYKDDFVSALDLAEQSKILDKPTAANFLAKQGGVQEEIDIARLFSYKEQDSRVYKLMQLREKAIKEQKLNQFYDALRFGMQFGVLNKDGIISLADALNELVDADSEEAQLLLDAIED